jgi:hypothetical protein
MLKMFGLAIASALGNVLQHWANGQLSRLTTNNTQSKTKKQK